MKELVFSTGNADKFLTALHTCEEYGIQLKQAALDIIEIQSEQPELVARDKAAKAYASVKKPVVITDDSWSFTGLNGFPGAYMHSMNEWLTADDFLRLILPLEDRRVILTQCLVFTDGSAQKVFTQQTNGTLLTEIRGSSTHPSLTIMSLDGDNGLSIAEAHARSGSKATRAAAKVWHTFASWYSSH